MGKKNGRAGLSDAIRNRIVDRRMVRARDLQDHPLQWRVHTDSQTDTMIGVLQEVGIASTLKAWHSDRAGGALVTWDGHLRKSLDPDLEWPVDILDITDAEADYLLSVFDPIAAMAQADAAALDSLLRTVSTDSAAVQSMLAELAESSGVVPPNVEFREYDESVADEVEYIECPECGHRWPK